MKKFSLVSLAIVVALAAFPASSIAQDSYYSFNFSDNNISVDGEFVTSDAVIPGYAGAQQILSFTGTITDTGAGDSRWNGTLSLYPGTAQFNTPDFNGVTNYFYPTGDGSVEGASGFQYFDGGGLVLTVNSGNLEWSIFGEGGGTYANYPGTGGDGFGNYADHVPGSDLRIAAPESSSLSMLALCALGLVGGFLFRAKKSGILNF